MSNTPQNTYIVTNLTDNGAAGTLRDALAQAQADISANASPGDGGYFDEVSFDPSLTGQTITLQSTLTVGSGIILDGTAKGASNITISGNSNFTIFTVPGTAAPDGNTLATINNLTIANGYGKGAGGSAGTATSPGGPGGDAAGGIFLQGGHLSVSNDTFNNTTAYGGSGGSGYTNPKGTGGSGGTKGAGGNGGNAAGAIYVEPGAVVDYASALVAQGSSANPGFPGYMANFGASYPVSNSDTVNNSTTIVCFASETRIRTARGEIAVEGLVVGDLVVTSTGGSRPIRWLGHRTVDCRRHPRPSDVMPVRIAAHALGDNRPARDLVVSPGHAVCVDVPGEVLVPAFALVNGCTIRQVDVEKVTYWHVELDSHDIILAENLPTESYLDMGNRGFFAESDVVALAAAPDAGSSQWSVSGQRSSRDDARRAPPIDRAGQAPPSHIVPQVAAGDEAVPATLLRSRGR